MRHHAEHVAARVTDTGDGPDRAVRVRLGRDPPLGVAVPQDDLPSGLESAQGRGIGDVAALPVLDGEIEHVAAPAAVGERRVGVLHAHVDALAEKGQAAIAHERAGKQTGFAENLEPVAESDHEAAGVRELGDRRHDRRKTRHRSAAQIVAVRETAGQQYTVEAVERGALVPETRDALAEHVLEHVRSLRVVVRPRKRDHTPAHVPSARRERAAVLTPVALLRSRNASPR